MKNCTDYFRFRPFQTTWGQPWHCDCAAIPPCGLCSCFFWPGWVMPARVRKIMAEISVDQARQNPIMQRAHFIDRLCGSISTQNQHKSVSSQQKIKCKKRSRRPFSHWGYCIIGAGPAGIQLGHFLYHAGRDYIIFERNSHAGSFFEKFPRHRKLISLNKRSVRDGRGHDFAFRHDWNSLIDMRENRTLPVCPVCKGRFFISQKIISLVRSTSEVTWGRAEQFKDEKIQRALSSCWRLSGLLARLRGWTKRFHPLQLQGLAMRVSIMRWCVMASKGMKWVEFWLPSNQHMSRGFSHWHSTHCIRHDTASLDLCREDIPERRRCFSALFPYFPAAVSASCWWRHRVRWSKWVGSSWSRARQDVSPWGGLNSIFFNHFFCLPNFQTFINHLVIQ